MENDVERKKIAFFGGSFDPIHLGHVNLAINMLEVHQLDKVYFSPAYCSPHKKNNQPIASVEQRVDMVKKVVEDVSSFELFDYEAKKKGFSYTIDALQEVLKIHPNDKLFLILTADLLVSFPTWKDVEKILNLSQPLVGLRNQEAKNIPATFKKYFEGSFTEMPIFDISSTQIRRRLQEKLYCGHLVPSNVLSYIYMHQIYQS
ncbi:MAG: nicotinate (nicotinamide) nucleotide adenylyltransferase [Chlamydiota bacterium]|jgi:nicotinate-nucleotide adenylyltransferase